MSKNHTAALALIATALLCDAAAAHPELHSADPPAGKASPAPSQIRILFNESVIPQFSGIKMSDQSGRTVAVGKATVDPVNKKMMVVPVKDPMAPGDYKVEWHAVSDDTHKVKGSYSFGVAR
jgi:methionine-rich copper-binding protein CopC